MAGTPAPKTVYRTLLQRVCDIAALAAWTNADGRAETVIRALPRRFSAIVGPYPLALVFVSNVRYVYAQKSVDHLATLTIQVWAGPVAAGSVGENEDRLNELYMAIPAEFEKRPALDSPTDGTPLDYVYPDDFSRLTEAPGGTGGFEVVDGSGAVTRYFGTEFMLAVHLRFPRSRLS